MTGFDTGLPSIRKIQDFVKEKDAVEIKLLTNEVLEGTIAWQDEHCLCLADEAQQTTLVWRQAIAYLKLKN